MSEKYDPEETRKLFDGVMECQLEWQAGPDMAQNALKLVPSLYAVSKKDALTLYGNIEQMGKYMAQMGQLIGQMQRRMDEMEARQAAVTIGHRDVLQLMARIRWKAGTTCMKYNLEDPESLKIIRAAIKKDVLKRYQVKDLHDLPAAMLPAAEKQIDSWTDIRLVMERRGNA